MYNDIVYILYTYGIHLVYLLYAYCIYILLYTYCIGMRICCMCTCMCLCLCLRLCVYVCAYMHVYMYVHVYTSIYLGTNIHIYVYIKPVLTHIISRNKMWCHVLQTIIRRIYIYIWYPPKTYLSSKFSGIYREFLNILGL